MIRLGRSIEKNEHLKTSSLSSSKLEVVRFLVLTGVSILLDVIQYRLVHMNQRWSLSEKLLGIAPPETLNSKLGGYI
jgi:hypothetical protein